MLTLRCLLLESELQTMQLDLDEALATLERARVLAESSLGAHDRASMVIHTRAANLLVTKGDVDGALERSHAALAFNEAAGNAFEAAHTRVQIAGMLVDEGRLAEAQPYVDAAGPVVLGSDEPQGRFIYETVLARFGRGEATLPARATTTRQRAGGRDRPRPAPRGRRHVAQRRGSPGRTPGPGGRRAVRGGDQIERRGGSLPMIYGLTQIAYARYLWDRGQRPRARALLEEALPHVRNHPGPPPQYTETIAWLTDEGIELDVCLSDAALLGAWKAGDAVAGRRLFDRHIGVVSRFFTNKVDHDVDDLIQLTFLSALQAADRF